VIKKLVAVVIVAVVVLTGCGPGLASLPEPAPPPVAPAAGKTWKRVFDDEFSGMSVDTSHFTLCDPWSLRTDCGVSFNVGREAYYPSQVIMKNGTASLVAEPMPPVSNSGCYLSQCDYKSGQLETAPYPGTPPGNPFKFTYTYGYLEARIKLPTTPGFFSAFWTLEANANGTYNWEDDTEIVGGFPNIIYMTHQFNNRTKSYRINNDNGPLAWGWDGNPDVNNAACPKIDYSSSWHTFAMDWEPTYIAWRVDGQECGRWTDATGETISNVPMFFLIQLMVDTNWQRSAAKTAPPGSTDHLDVDYVRVWQQV
jgi:beta-glucanase (GH16 family)